MFNHVRLIQQTICASILSTKKNLFYLGYIKMCVSFLLHKCSRSTLNIFMQLWLPTIVTQERMSGCFFMFKHKWLNVIVLT